MRVTECVYPSANVPCDGSLVPLARAADVPLSLFSIDSTLSSCGVLLTGNEFCISRQQGRQNIGQEDKGCHTTQMVPVKSHNNFLRPWVEKGVV